MTATENRDAGTDERAFAILMIVLSVVIFVAIRRSVK
jgi:uncharacterized membrane protein